MGEEAVAVAGSGQCILLEGARWDTYCRLVEDFEDSHAAHFAFDRGILEIMVLSLEHEFWNRLLAALFELLAEELDVDFENVGSATFRRDDLEKGFEPDTAFYVKNLESIRGKTRLDPQEDPAPDLVIEVDISHPSLDKLPILVALGVGEVWRFDGTRTTILRRRKDRYVQAAASGIFPILTPMVLTDWLHQARNRKRTVWLRELRKWVRRQADLGCQKSEGRSRK